MIDLNRFHLDGLRAVEVVARQGTLARAAAELGTSPRAVSQLVIRAEKQLGRPVFQRLPSGLKPTEFGGKLVKHLEQGFVALAQGVSSALENQFAGTACGGNFVACRKVATSPVARLPAANPKIRVQIDSGLALKDMNQAEVDVALRFGKGHWPGAKAEHLTDFYVFPVCSPTVARQLKTPTDLNAATIISYEGARDRWEDWARAAGLTEPLRDGLSFSDAALCTDAAIAGLGVALSWDLLLADALRDGRLVRPFARTVHI